MVKNRLSTRIEIQVSTFEAVVDLPTPSAPPRVVIPLWQQIVITSYSIHYTKLYEENDEADSADFLPSTTADINELKDELRRFLDSITA